MLNTSISYIVFMCFFSLLQLHGCRSSEQNRLFRKDQFETPGRGLCLVCWIFHITPLLQRENSLKIDIRPNIWVHTNEVWGIGRTGTGWHVGKASTLCQLLKCSWAPIREVSLIKFFCLAMVSPPKSNRTALTNVACAASFCTYTCAYICQVS